MSVDDLDALEARVSDSAWTGEFRVPKEDLLELVALARRASLIPDGIDPDLFGTVCAERDAAEAQVKELREALADIAYGAAQALTRTEPNDA